MFTRKSAVATEPIDLDQIEVIQNADEAQGLYPFPSAGDGGVFLLDPRSARILRGQRITVLTRRSIRWFAALLVTVLFAAAMSYGLYDPQRHLDRINAGPLVLAEIISAWPPESLESSTDYLVAIQYMAFNKRTQRTERVSTAYDVEYALGRTLRLGSKVDLRHNPDYIYHSVIVGNSVHQREANAVTIWIAVPAAFTTVILVLTLLQLWRDHRLSHRGQLITGTITHVENNSNWKGLRLKIYYSFAAPDGATIGNEASRLRNDLRMPRLAQVTENIGFLPHEGTACVVLYLNRSSYRLL